MSIPAFRADVKTETREHKGKEDEKAPDWRKLEAASIGTPSGLQGVPTCTDGKLVHGDLQEMMYNNRETHIVQNDTILIGQKYKETVEDTSDITIKQGRELMVGVYDKTEIKGDRTLWVHGSDDEHYLIHREIDEPNEKFEHKHASFEYGWFSAEAMALAFETKALAVAIENLKIEAKMFAQTNELIEGDIDGLTAKAEGLDVALGLLMLKAKFTLNALPNWATSTPIS